MTTLNDVPGRVRSVRISSENIGTVEVPQAGTYLRRLRGLLFGGEQLLLRPCSSVHGIGMRRSLDVAYIAGDGTVLDVAALKPWRAHRPRRGAKAAWEAPEGTFAQLGLTPGALLRFQAA
ncbi:DUF192 domain-containing protein [Nesterenkonia sp.]|uniref:DUF192 domain-containing protein n=1 Tax=Nesterenkonia sp. TaxID=704201 RepID=UPI00262A0EAC|nr:DUF192 domain-containing protein [Nesterenkonia sp.]